MKVTERGLDRLAAKHPDRVDEAREEYRQEFANKPEGYCLCNEETYAPHGLCIYCEAAMDMAKYTVGLKYEDTTVYILTVVEAVDEFEAQELVTKEIEESETADIRHHITRINWGDMTRVLVKKD